MVHPIEIFPWTARALTFFDFFQNNKLNCVKTLTAQQHTKLERQTITSHNTQANATRENNTIDKIVQHRQDCLATAGTQRTRMAKKRVETWHLDLSA